MKMTRTLLGLALMLLGLAPLPASAQISAVAPGYRLPSGQVEAAIGVFCLDLSGNYAGCGSSSQTTSGAIQPPTAASGKISKNSVALSAATSTQIAPANASRIALLIQCDGTGAVGVDETGGTLTSATSGTTVIIPAGSYPGYIPPIASLTAITAYTGTAQTCRVTEYLR